MFRAKKFLAGFLFLLALSVVIPLAHLRGSTDGAVAYLKSKPLSPWSIMALAASGESPSLDSLKTLSSDKAIDYEAPILALTAAGKDPRTFGSTDLVAKLKSFYNGAQLGDPTTLNDDIFGLLALLSSGEAPNSQVAAGIEKFIVGKQHADGGFAFAEGSGSDTNTTAAAIMALRAASVSASAPSLVKAEAYLKAAQNDDGGFPYDPKSQWGAASDASSDAFVIMAAKALGEDASSWQKGGKSPVQNLESLKDPRGFYLYQPGAAEDSFTPVTTSYALLALSGKTLPAAALSPPKTPAAVSFSVRVEGKESELCQTEGEGRTALDALKTASSSCGLPYHAQSSSLGEYVDEINGEKAAGASGWLYDVNAVSPSVGAADYTLSAGDSVVWYFGDYGWKEMRLSLATSSVPASAPVTGVVDYFDNGGWKPLSGATVKSGDISAATDGAGAFSLALSAGRRSVVAEKPGYVRSEAENVAVGSPERAEIPLSVSVPAETGGSAAGGLGSGSNSSSGSSGPSSGSISVVVESAGAGGGAEFGAVSRGGVAQKNVTLRNNGSSASTFSASVSGDALFRRYLTLNNRGWRSFRVTLAGSFATTTVVSLLVPADYRESGVKTGALVFWATPAAQ